MKLSRQHIFLLLAAFINLAAGSLNYLFFHPDIILFHVIHLPAIHLFSIENIFIQHFLTGYFSDITWCIALCLVTIVLADLNYLKRGGIMLILTVPFLSEAAQYFGFILGTFDWYDVLTYLAIVFLFVLFSSTLKQKLYEKD